MKCEGPMHACMPLPCMITFIITSLVTLLLITHHHNSLILSLPPSPRHTPQFHHQLVLLQSYMIDTSWPYMVAIESPNHLTLLMEIDPHPSFYQTHNTI